MPVRIYDIAKKLGLNARVVIVKAKELGIAAAKVPSSSLDNVSAQKLEQALAGLKVEVQQRNIRAFGLGNFKAFAETQSVPVRPLTLIFGANSSGKSSIIHGLLMGREGVDTGKLDVFKTEIGGDAVDLGGFRQFVHRRQVDRRVEWAAEFGTQSLQGNAYLVLGEAKSAKVSLVFGMPLDDKGKPSAGCVPRLEGYDITADGELLMRLTHREGGVMQLARFNVAAFRPIVRTLLAHATTTATGFTTEDEAFLGKAIEDMGALLRFECEQLLPENLVGYDFGSQGMHQLMAINKGDRREQLAEAARMFIPRAVLEVLRGVNTELRLHLRRIVYLGPLRSFPPRHLAFMEDSDPNWYAGGGYAWDIVRRDAALRESVNAWLGNAERLQTPYRLVVEKLFTGTDVQSSLSQGFELLAADIVARLLGEVQTVKADIGILLEERSHIEEERFQVEKEANSTREMLVSLLESRTMLEGYIANASSRAEKLRMHRDVLVHGSKAGEVQAKELAEVGKQFAMLQTELEGNRKILSEVKKQEDWLRKDELRLTERGMELDRQKAQIFSDMQANLDSQDLSKRLYAVLEGRSDLNASDELMLKDCRTDTFVTHRDVGIGVSQVLPVLVHAYADKGKIVAIEQPEIHLHPKLQAELADVFIESALGERKNTFILETHSEHLILRVMRRIRETKMGKLPEGAISITNKDVSILFVEPGPGGSVVREMPLNEMGELVKSWPGGFFEDGYREMFG